MTDTDSFLLEHEIPQDADGMGRRTRQGKEVSLREVEKRAAELLPAILEEAAFEADAGRDHLNLKVGHTRFRRGTHRPKGLYREDVPEVLDALVVALTSRDFAACYKDGRLCISWEGRPQGISS